MMQLTIQQIKHNVRLELSSFKDLFSDSTDLRRCQDKIDNETKTLTISWPKHILLNEKGGFLLKDASGYISLRQTYRYDGGRALEKISHSYRFISNYHSYVYLKEGIPIQSDPVDYNYRYDSDPGHKKDNLQNHIQVLHSFPRFFSREVGVAEFLQTVKGLCLDNTGDTSKQSLLVNRY